MQGPYYLGQSVCMFMLTTHHSDIIKDLDHTVESCYLLPPMRIAIISLLLLLSWVSPVQAEHKRLEKEYQQDWCLEASGHAEVRLPDGTRADCITRTHAIEFDFGQKWAESIGQALYYSMQTGKRAGIVLILERVEDRKYWIRLNSIVEFQKLPIDSWKIENF